MNGGVPGAARESVHNSTGGKTAGATGKNCMLAE